MELGDTVTVVVELFDRSHQTRAARVLQTAHLPAYFVAVPLGENRQVTCWRQMEGIVWRRGAATPEDQAALLAAFALFWSGRGYVPVSELA